MLDGDLGFAVGSEVVEFVVFSYVGELFGELVGEVDAEWKVRLGLVGCVADGHALVSCSLVVLCHGGIDFLALFVELVCDGGFVWCDAEGGVGVPDALKCLFYDVVDVYRGVCFDFSGYGHVVVGDEAFDGCFGVGVVS